MRANNTLRKKCPHSQFYCSVFFCIRTEKLRIIPYSVLMRKNTDQKNSEYGDFSRSAGFPVLREHSVNVKKLFLTLIH